MSLHLMVLPPERHSSLLRDAGPVDTGLLVFCARPARRDYALHMDLLSALGVRHDVRTGRSRPGAERTLQVIRAWLLAHRVRAVVVCFAEAVEPDAFAALSLTAADAGTDLVLVTDDFSRARPRKRVDEPMDRGVRLAGWAHDNGASILSVGDADSYLAARTRPWAGTAGQQMPFPQVLPSCDWTLWRSRCRDVLSPGDYETVDAVYRSAFRRTVADSPSDSTACRDLLASLVCNVGSPAEAACVARAVQAAMFTLGYLVTMKVSALLTSVDEGHHGALAPDQIRALRAYREPWVAVVTVMRRIGLEYANISNTRVRNVTEDGSLRQRGLSRDVPDEACVLLRAQRHLRLLEGAGPDDPFVDRPARSVAEAVRWTTQDLALPGVERRARRGGGHWLDRADLRVRKLDDTWKGLGQWSTRSL